MDLTYPAEPWDLHGHGLVSAGLLPREFPLTPPPGTRVVRLAGRPVAGAVLLTYTAPSPLTYHELMLAVLVRRGLRCFVHIPHIWVDSAASRAGGRELWAIPKELATFEDRGRRATGIAAASIHRIRGALRVPSGFRVVQTRADRALETSVRGRATVSPAGASWQFDPTGPLAAATGFRPLLHVLIRRFHLTFGSADHRDARQPSIRTMEA